MKPKPKWQVRVGEIAGAVVPEDVRRVDLVLYCDRPSSGLPLSGGSAGSSKSGAILQHLCEMCHP